MRGWTRLYVCCAETLFSRLHIGDVTLPGCRTHSILAGCLQWPQTSTWRWTASLTSTGAGAERTMTLLPGEEGESTTWHDYWEICKLRMLTCSASEQHAHVFLVFSFTLFFFSFIFFSPHIYSSVTTCSPSLWLLVLCVLTSSFIFTSPPSALALLCVSWSGLSEYFVWICLAHSFGLGQCWKKYLEPSLK